MKYKNILPCPRCGKDVVLEKLRPHKKSPSTKIITQESLCCYLYTCPFCKLKSSFNKDYVFEVWRERNPHVLIAKKL